MDLETRKERILGALKLSPMTCKQLADCIGIDSRAAQGAVISLMNKRLVRRIDRIDTTQSVYDIDEPNIEITNPLELITKAMATEGAKHNETSL